MGTPHRRRTSEQDRFWRFADPVVRRCFLPLFRTRWIGLENIPARGSGLLAANHLSPLDPIFIALAPSQMGRTIRFLAGAEFFERPVLGNVLTRLHQIPIRRGASDWRAMGNLSAAIANGTLAGIFPEGRIGESGNVGRGHRGAARLALTANVPVIPVGVWGTQQRWPRGGLRFDRPLRPKITVVFGGPIAPVGDPRDRQSLKEFTDRIMSAIVQAVERAKAV
jgi:1-acyl-sn-glycerol-3-phosphate acyltransferase